MRQTKIEEKNTFTAHDCINALLNTKHELLKISRNNTELRKVLTVVLVKVLCPSGTRKHQGRCHASTEMKRLRSRVEQACTDYLERGLA